MTAPDPRPDLPPRPSQLAAMNAAPMPPTPGARTLPPRPSTMAAQTGPDRGAPAPSARPLPPRPSQTTTVTAGVRPTPPRPAPVAKARPDPRPMRLGLGAAAIAALSIMAAGLVRFPTADPTAASEDTALAQAPARDVRIAKRVRYVQLKPGQKAPPGAKVIDSAAPTPRVVVRTIQAVAPAVVRRTTTRTRQSGRP